MLYNKERERVALILSAIINPVLGDLIIWVSTIPPSKQFSPISPG